MVEIATQTSDGPSQGLAESEPVEAPRPRRRRRHPWRRRVALVLAVLMVPVLWSYATALTAPGSDSFTARTAEWLRGNHLGALVSWAEHISYSLHPPRKGGTPSARAGLAVAAAPVTDPVGPGPTTQAPGTSAQGHQSTAVSAPPPTPLPPVGVPAPLVSPAAPAVAGEGRWTPIGPLIGGAAGVYATVIRPDAVHTSYLDAVVWLDPRRVLLRQFPGTFYSGGPSDRPPYVPAGEQASLIAAFEGGFRPGDSRGGLQIEQQSLAPLRQGAATLAIKADGTADVGILGRDFQASAGYDSFRQNLSLIVDNGAPVSQLASDPNRTWGFTGPANKEFVWRSGVGVTASGALVWVGGPALSIEDLADTLVRAGAIRGMQLDINQDWVQFNTYAAGAAGQVHGSKLLAGMRHTGDRYLSTDSRDFVAVFARPAALG